MKNPITLLEEELNILKRCLEKSIVSFEKGEIDAELHNIHLKNLDPTIQEFEKAIKILKDEETKSNKQ